MRKLTLKAKRAYLTRGIQANKPCHSIGQAIRVKPVVTEAIEYVEDAVLPLFKQEPGLGSQISDYNFLLEFSDRKDANPRSLIQESLNRGLQRIRLFGYVPQCLYHCAYCPFPTTNDGLQEDDAQRLVREASTFKARMGALPPVESLSIGGGTPTSLTADGIRRLVTGIREAYEIPLGTYLNMECSPDTIDPEKVDAANRAGVTRFSMGVQTFDDRSLERCTRNHTGADAEAACKLLLGRDFQDINIDLMRGLPGQGLEQFADDIQRFITTGIPSLHLYRLRLPLKHPLLRHEPYTLEYLRNVLAMLVIADRFLAEAGYRRHHTAHWTKNPNAGAVTSRPWDFGKAEFGFGMGAYSYLPVGEARNVKSPTRWRQLVDSDTPTFHMGTLYSQAEQEVRWIKFALKTLSLDTREHESCLSKPIEANAAWPRVERLIELGILSMSGQRIAFTEAGYVVAEEALRFLLRTFATKATERATEATASSVDPPKPTRTTL